jgi:hypothetical protein
MDVLILGKKFQWHIRTDTITVYPYEVLTGEFPSLTTWTFPFPEETKTVFENPGCQQISVTLAPVVYHRMGFQSPHVSLIFDRTGQKVKPASRPNTPRGTQTHTRWPGMPRSQRIL